MRNSQRNWMVENDGGWNDMARSLDWDMQWYSEYIENEDLVRTRDLLNNHESLRKVMLFVHERRWNEIEGLRKENESLAKKLSEVRWSKK